MISTGGPRAKPNLLSLFVELSKYPLIYSTIISAVIPANAVSTPTPLKLTPLRHVLFIILSIISCFLKKISDSQDFWISVRVVRDVADESANIQ